MADQAVMDAEIWVWKKLRRPWSQPYRNSGKKSGASGREMHYPNSVYVGSGELLTLSGDIMEGLH